MFGLYTLIISACLVYPTHQAWSVGNETSLKNFLKNGYDETVRPQELTLINMYFQMVSIDSIDIKSQVFQVSGWWMMSWNDTRLVWDTATYADINYVMFYEDDIWKPAIVVSSSNTDLSAIDEGTIPARVDSTGQVTWSPPGILSMGCDIDSTYFPFDRQACSIVVTSFGYTFNEVNIDSDDGIKTDYYNENGDWSIKSMIFSRDVYYDGGFPYARVTYTIEVKRRSTFHWINIMIPIMINSILICFVFLLPSDSGEKMGYSLTCLLTYVVLLTLVAADMPTSAKHTSLLEVYITIVLTMSALSVLLSQFVLHLHHREDEIYIITPWMIKLTRFAMVIVNDVRYKENMKDTSKVHPDTYKTENGMTTRPSSTFKAGAPPQSKTPVRPLTSAGDDDDHGINWRIIADVADAVFLRFYLIVIGLVTISFLMALTLGDA